MKSSPGLLKRFRSARKRYGGLVPLLKSRLRKGPDYPSKTTENPDPAASPSQQWKALRQPQAPNTDLTPGITLIGHPYAVLGRAEDIRTAACSLAEAGIPFGMINLYGDYDSDNRSRHRDFPHFHRVGETADHRANLFYLNADEMQAAVERLGADVFSGPYNIGCFAWELSQFPQPWVSTFDLLHEIWAPTRFIQDAISPTTSLPVIHMPFAIEPGPTATGDRKDSGLPENKFIFLFFFDFRSYIQRKNPWAVLQAFFLAFPADSHKAVHLIIKVNGVEEKADDYRLLLEHPFIRDPRVQVIDQVLDDRGIKTLVQQCDCFVSLHRSEGFGRGLAEAMYYGKPVIATGYSGNLDFMNEKNSCLVDYSLIPLADEDYPFAAGQHWADADVEQAATYMTRLVDDADYAGNIGRQAAAYIREFHSYAAVGAACRKRLRTLGITD